MKVLLAANRGACLGLLSSLDADGRTPAEVAQAQCSQRVTETLRCHARAGELFAAVEAAVTEAAAAQDAAQGAAAKPGPGSRSSRGDRSGNYSANAAGGAVVVVVGGGSRSGDDGGDDGGGTEAMGKITRLLEDGSGQGSGGLGLNSLAPASGLAPLHLAAAAGLLELARVLLKAGADPSLRQQQQGDAPLHGAARHGHADVCEVLLRTPGGAAVLLSKVCPRFVLLLEERERERGAWERGG